MVATFYSAPNSMVKVNIGRRLLLLADLKRIVISLSPSCSWVRLPQSHTSHWSNYIMSRFSWWLTLVAYTSGRACLQTSTATPRTTNTKYPAHGCVEPQSIPVWFSRQWWSSATDPWAPLLRIVRNDFVSKPLSKGILDGNLLAHYETLPITRQNEMTRQIGTERLTLLKDWISLSGAWWKMRVYNRSYIIISSYCIDIMYVGTRMVCKSRHFCDIVLGTRRGRLNIVALLSRYTSLSHSYTCCTCWSNYLNQEI